MTWGDALPWLVALPWTGAVATLALGARGPRVAGGLAWIVLIATTALAVGPVLEVARHGPFSYALGGWPAPYGVELRFDHFSAWVLPLALLFVLIVPFSWRYLEGTIPHERQAPFYALLLLNAGAMIGFTISADLFNLFVFMEVVSLSSYALVAIAGRGLAAWAALKYLLIGAVASMLMLLGVTFVFVLTGSVNLADVTARLAAGVDPVPAATAIALLATSFLVKAALFPLHVWLPDAHAIAPSPVSAVLSGMVVKIGIVGLIRLYQLAYGSAAFEMAGVNMLLVWVGAIAIVMGAFLAMVQNDIKLMLAYSTISNVGYIVMGLALASPYAAIGGVAHVFNHALIKVTLFLAAGALIHATGFRTLTDLSGVARAMPYTAATMAIGAISIVGLPPTAGFVCKWYIALGAFQARQAGFGFALVFGALLIFVYYVRMLNALYFKPALHDAVRNATEVPWSMRAPMLLAALACLVMGVLGGVPLSFVEPAVLDMLPAWGP
ncbi:MAG: proton-conducting transporter membrane subunit [Trueperaceae bacterium]|nr:proton-conducting transporter membrane subunit [Trueperaceae bacterium]